MNKSYLLDPIQILHGPDKKVISDAVLFIDKQIQAFGEEARVQAKKLKIAAKSAKHLLLAPCLVDPHSVLENHLNSRVETISTLLLKAANAGYGQIALLPRSSIWRDKPEHLQPLSDYKKDVLIHLWGSFSQKGKGEELAPHKELLDFEAIGLADDDSIIPTELLRKGIMLNELRGRPLLVAPRDRTIQGHGIARETVEALRSGWSLDPIESETIPLAILLELQKQYPKVNLRLMNLSTADGVSMLASNTRRPLATVSWWHLVADQSSLASTDIGIRVVPSLGSKKDRLALKEGLRSGILTGVSVSGVALDDAETKKPISERAPGLNGYHLVLPFLWQELIEKSQWSIEELWEAISFGPSKILNLPKEELNLFSNRWILFDPKKQWVQNNVYPSQSLGTASNQPWKDAKITGQVIDCGLTAEFKAPPFD